MKKIYIILFSLFIFLININNTIPTIHNKKNKIGSTANQFQFDVLLIILFISLVVVTIIDDTADIIPVIAVHILTAFSYVSTTFISLRFI